MQNPLVEQLLAEGAALREQFIALLRHPNVATAQTRTQVLALQQAIAANQHATHRAARRA